MKCSTTAKKVQLSHKRTAMVDRRGNRLRVNTSGDIGNRSVWNPSSSTSKDPTLAVYLEDVDEDGFSTLIIQEFIRASHQTLAPPPFSTGGTPWISSLAEHVEAAAPLTEGPAQIRLALKPTSDRFIARHRIRVTLATSDEGVIWVVPDDPRPVVTMWRDAERPSRITLPVLPD